MNALITKIKLALDNYESTDDVEEWKIEFEVGVRFEEKDFAAIRHHHSKLLNTESTACKVKLLVCAERGRMYNYLKYYETGFGNWEKVCADLNICRVTANRYIDFFRIVSGYPRLQICGVSFESIMCIYRRLQEYLSTDDTLADRLKQPLKQTRIACELTLFSSDACGGEVETPPAKLLTENEAWYPGWEIEDEIVESRETETSETFYDALNDHGDSH